MLLNSFRYFLERSHSARLTLAKACELCPEEVKAFFVSFISSFSFIFIVKVNAFIFWKDQEEPEGDVEGENGTSADEASPNAQPSSPCRDSQNQSPPVADQIPPLDNNDTVDNESTKLLNEESD